MNPGTMLGPYEVLSLLGAGGMGEVYKARDTRLDRIVAIKILPAHLAGKPELRERFEREARTIAGLNHPHICTLYDIGRQDGIDFLVMEYLEGETLATRLLKGPLPLDQVLRYAIEVSDALDKAHRKGVTHRDVKPGNIMLTKNGSKLLDFGLAKLKQEAAPAAVPLSQLPTLSKNPTVEGTILGTLQYMAPEQLEGKVNEIDGRTDIFAFGALVYEMATGKKAFEGKTAASLIAKILETEPPPISSLQPMTPAALDRVIRKCLRKDPDERWQSARDVADELKWITEADAQVSRAASPDAKSAPKSWSRSVILGLAAAVVAAVAGLAGWILRPAPAPSEQPVSRFTIALPPGEALAGVSAVALSPDGRQLAYVAARGATRQLYLRAMDGFESRAIAGTEGAAHPFFSPDGQWLGFFAQGKLKKVSVDGGAVLTLADSMTTRGASWDRQGSIFFVTSSFGTVLRVSDTGGTPQALTRHEGGETSHRWPELLPDGNAILFAAGQATANFANGAKIVVQSLQTGDRRDLIQQATYPRYAPSGHLVYAQAGNLLAVPFDPQRLEVTGAAVPVVEGVLQTTGDGNARYTISSTGSLAYVPGRAEFIQSRLVWVSRNGAETILPGPARYYRAPRLSPDGRRVAVAINDQETQVWLYDLSRETLSRLTFEGNTNVHQIWTPDGRWIVFQSNKEGPQNVFRQLADGSGAVERLTTGDAVHLPGSWSADGEVLAIHESSSTVSGDIRMLRLADPARGPQPFLRTPFNEESPMFSPDGRWLAYSSDEAGRKEVYVQPYPGPGGKVQISTDGGIEPLWNPNGRELFYRSGDRMMAVEIATEPAFSAGRPRVLFEGQYLISPAGTPNYDISSDGQRFLLVKPLEQQVQPTQINVVLNWGEELKRRVPAGQ
jgi:serine/threonine-protein kinase